MTPKSLRWRGSTSLYAAPVSIKYRERSTQTAINWNFSRQFGATLCPFHATVSRNKWVCAIRINKESKLMQELAKRRTEINKNKMPKYCLNWKLKTGEENISWMSKQRLNASIWRRGPLRSMRLYFKESHLSISDFGGTQMRENGKAEGRVSHLNIISFSDRVRQTEAN